MALIPFNELGCTPEFEEAYRACVQQGELGRVTSLDRGYPLVNTAEEEVRAELSTTIKKSDDSIVAIGDWVVLDCAGGHEKAIIRSILPRRMEVARIKRVGRENQVRRQVLAANVDTVFICQSLTGAGLDRQLAQRQIAAVYGCGAKPVFVLTKSDMVEEEETRSAIELLARIAPELEVVSLAMGVPAGVERVRCLCSPKTTSMLLGESGVGKSTLVNALVGELAAQTGEVRASDDKGRHTTVARRLLAIPGGGLIIDAPGLRTLQIIDLGRSLQAMFPDVDELSQSCRFSDCTHVHEPGCAVREGVAAERLRAYFELSAGPRKRAD